MPSSNAVQFRGVIIALLGDSEQNDGVRLVALILPDVGALLARPFRGRNRRWVDG